MRVRKNERGTHPSPNVIEIAYFILLIISFSAVIETGSISMNFVSLLFKDYASNKEYVVTATTGEDGDVKADVS